MKSKIIILILVIILLSIFVSVSYYSNRGSKVLKVFLGAAAEKPWEEIIDEFEKRTGIKVDVVFGGSGTLLSQIEISKMGDIYAPGSPDYMVRAIEKGIVNSKDIHIVAYMIPAIIVPKGNPKNITKLEDLAKLGVRIGIGDPETVCVGEYAIELLKYNGLYDDVVNNIVVLCRELF